LYTENTDSIYLTGGPSLCDGDSGGGIYFRGQQHSRYYVQVVLDGIQNPISNIHGFIIMHRDRYDATLILVFGTIFCIPIF
jgi:hypothetical protein